MKSPFAGSTLMLRSVAPKEVALEPSRASPSHALTRYLSHTVCDAIEQGCMPTALWLSKRVLGFLKQGFGLI